MESVFESSNAASKGSPPSNAASKGSTNVAELMAADAEDESLRRYKEALLGSAAHGDLGDTSDSRRVVLTKFVIAFEASQGMEDLTFDLDSPAGMQALQQSGIIMKEGAKFKFKISFRVQREICVGIKFVNAVSKLFFAEREELMIGSYPPSSTAHSFEFPKWDYNEAPAGMMYRGKYNVKNSFYTSAEMAPIAEFEYQLLIVPK